MKIKITIDGEDILNSKKWMVKFENEDTTRSAVPIPISASGEESDVSLTDKLKELNIQVTQWNPT